MTETRCELVGGPADGMVIKVCDSADMLILPYVKPLAAVSGEQFVRDSSENVPRRLAQTSIGRHFYERDTSRRRIFNYQRTEDP